MTTAIASKATNCPATDPINSSPRKTANGGTNLSWDSGKTGAVMKTQSAESTQENAQELPQAIICSQLAQRQSKRQRNPGHYQLDNGRNGADERMI